MRGGAEAKGGKKRREAAVSYPEMRAAGTRQSAADEHDAKRKAKRQRAGRSAKQRWGLVKSYVNHGWAKLPKEKIKQKAAAHRDGEAQDGGGGGTRARRKTVVFRESRSEVDKGLRRVNSGRNAMDLADIVQRAGSAAGVGTANRPSQRRALKRTSSTQQRQQLADKAKQQQQFQQMWLQGVGSAPPKSKSAAAAAGTHAATAARGASSPPCFSL